MHELILIDHNLSKSFKFIYHHSSNVRLDLLFPFFSSFGLFFSFSVHLFSSHFSSAQLRSGPCGHNYLTSSQYHVCHHCKLNMNALFPRQSLLQQYTSTTSFPKKCPTEHFGVKCSHELLKWALENRDRKCKKLLDKVWRKQIGTSKKKIWDNF